MIALVLAAETAVAPICTDRPTKANAVCTVPEGAAQVETGLASGSLLDIGRVRTVVLALGSTVAKVGLSDRSDLQIVFTPHARLSIRQSGSGHVVSGVGDVIVRYKHRLTGDHSKVQVGIIPFVKLPTANHGLGNGKAEGGIAFPIAIPAGRATVTFGPELDLLSDADGHGRHAAIVNLVNVSGPIVPRLTVFGELWSNLNFDSSSTIRQASADFAVAFAVTDDAQLDVGTNIGLTRQTADIELYAGASIRF